MLWEGRESGGGGGGYSLMWAICSPKGYGSSGVLIINRVSILDK